MSRRKKGKGKLRKWHYLAILVVVVLLSSWFTYSWCSPEIKRVKVYLTVGEYMGINVNASALWYGTIPRGGIAKRDLIITNGDSWPRRVWIRAEGEIAEWLSVTDNGFLLQPDEGKKVGVVVKVPMDAELRNYTAEIEVILIRSPF